MLQFDGSKSHGLLDTNVIVHALRNDADSDMCRRFMDELMRGERRAYLAPYVVHELTYVLGRHFKQMTRSDIAMLLGELVAWPGIDCDQELLTEALRRWGKRSELAFVDALLTTEAARQASRVFTRNIRDFVAEDVAVPDPLDNYRF